MAKPPTPLLAAERAVWRWARLLRDVHDLTLEGVAEPRRWIGCAERFWLGMAEDAGEWLHVVAADEAGSGTPPSARDVHRAVLPAGYRVLELLVEIPLWVFETLECEVVTLRSSALQCGDDLVAVPGRNLRMDPPQVTSAERVAKLRVFDLGTLHPGMELRGVIWAEPPPGEMRTRNGALSVEELRILVS